MKKILYLHHEPISSEKANLIQVVSMCKAMASIGHQITLSLPESETDDAIKWDNRSINIHIRNRKFKNKRFDKYLNFQAVRDSVKSVEPEILYLRNPLILKQTLRLGIPIIYEVHHNKLHNRFRSLDFYWRSKLLEGVKSGKILRIVCISQALSDYWINQGFPANKVITAHDGVDVKMFSEPMSKSEARKKLKLAGHRIIISYVGRLYSDRNIEDIIKLAIELNDATFLIVGGPEERKEFYQALAKDAGARNLIFTGQVDYQNVPVYLCASDVLLALWSVKVPTINYCSPLKLFEYMGSERIIVAHAFPTIKEILSDGKNAFLVNPRSFSDLVTQTKRALYSDQKNKIAFEARRHVLQNYTWKSRAEEILNF